MPNVRLAFSSGAGVSLHLGPSDSSDGPFLLLECGCVPLITFNQAVYSVIDGLSQTVMGSLQFKCMYVKRAKKSSRSL